MLLTEAIRASDRARGWLSVREQTLLYNLARAVPTEGTIVELGSWNGRSTIMLAAGSLKGRRAQVYAIDLFSITGEVGKIYEPDVENGMNNYLPLFEKNIREAGVDSVVVPISGYTTEGARAWSDRPINLLFIDADHSYDGVRSDFLEWVVHCSPLAWCAFHDYTNARAPGVQTFVNQLLEARVLRGIRGVDSIIAGKIAVTDRSEIERRLAKQPGRQRLFRAADVRAARFLYSLASGWDARERGDWKQAIRFGMESIRLFPWRQEGWRLFAVAVLKRSAGVPILSRIRQRP